MTFLEQFPPFPVCCMCISLRTGSILTALYFILESVAQIVGKAIYLSYENPDNDGKCRFCCKMVASWNAWRAFRWRHLVTQNNVFVYISSGYVFWTLLGQIAFWHVAQIILAVILLLGSIRVSDKLMF